MSVDPSSAAPPDSDALQFDHVVDPAGASADARGGGPFVACAGCGTAMTAEYYHVNGKPTCDACRAKAAAGAVAARGAAAWVRAVLFGLGAAIAGAVLYYAVIALTDFEIGVVAIAIGYMVGWAVHRAVGGRGGRKFQILAAVLTYWAVGLAYTPIAMKGMTDDRPALADSARVDSARAAAPHDSARSRAVAANDGPTLAGFAYLFAFTFALPVVVVVGSLPGGILSAAIIFFGLRQAWRMTGTAPYKVSGPYRVGPAPA